MKKKIGNILPLPPIAVKSELSTQVLSEDEQAMVCGGFYVGRRVSKADPVRQSGNRLTIDTASKIQESLKRVCDEQSRQGETVPNRRCAETKCRHEQISDLTGGDNAVKSELSTTAYNKNKQQAKKLCAFTLAEILLSLTIIGIVAAIALPSLLGNANERAWETQKKALYTRFSQSLALLPSLNGYGELVGNLSDCDDTNSCHPDSELKDTAAETFVRDGLSKVMKITNICAIPANTEGADAAAILKDCGLPDKIIALDGTTTINLSSITTFGALNQNITTYSRPFSNSILYQQQDSNAAAFETVNGESIIAYYNPYCASNMPETDDYYAQSNVCANFIYDLNGKKGPNTVGKDIGFMTALYATDSDVVAPLPYPNYTGSTIAQTAAAAKCKELYGDGRLPNIQEAISLFANRKLVRSDSYPEISTSTSVGSIGPVAISIDSGHIFFTGYDATRLAMCVKR